MLGGIYQVLLCVKMSLDVVYTAVAVPQPFSFYVGCVGAYTFSTQPQWAKGARANILNSYAHV